MTINLAHLEIRLSGGTANTDPSASLGGQRSSERVLAQSTTALSNITGVTIDYAGGNALGAGTLAYDLETTSLTWTPNGGSAGSAVDVSEGGRFAVFAGGNNGVLLVDVVQSGLPVDDESDSVTIANIANDVLDDVSKAESYAGDVEYRCIYLFNAHDADPFLDIIAYVAAQPSPGTMAFGLDPAGIGTGLTHNVVGITRSGTTATAEITGHGMVTGLSVTFAGADQAQYNGTFTITVSDANHVTYTVSGSPTTPATGTITASSGVAQTVANENTAPTGVTFDNPSSSGTGTSIGEVATGLCQAIWLRRTIPARNTESDEASVTQLAAQAFF